MRLMKVLVVAAAFGLTPIGAAADSASADAKAERKERLVCFAEKATGSNLRKRICMTPAERERRRKEDQAEMNDRRRTSAAAGTTRKD